MSWLANEVCLQDIVNSSPLWMRDMLLGLKHEAFFALSWLFGNFIIGIGLFGYFITVTRQ